MTSIFVTGIGIISAIGRNAAENHASLKKGKSGIGKIELFPTTYAGIRPSGEIKLTNQQLRNFVNEQNPSATRTTLLALHAFDEAVHNSNISADQLSSADTAFICASTVGGISQTNELFRDTTAQENGSAFLQSYDYASPTLFITSRYKIKGPVNSINTACSSSANAIMFGARLIQHGFARRAIVGGTDSLALFTVNGFNSLRILSDDHCKPFSKNRKGLNLGEGAAFLVLEKEEDANNKMKYAKIGGFGNANDAFHPSSLSDEGHGPHLSMLAALENAALQPSHIDFINAHGTGTENNDLAESRAMLSLFKNVPSFASTKANTGHTLGAAGAIEAVFSIFNLQYQEIYGALQFDEPITETGLLPQKDFQQKQIRHVMSNSFGFGGNCTSLIFSAP